MIINKIHWWIKTIRSFSPFQVLQTASKWEWDRKWKWLQLKDFKTIQLLIFCKLSSMKSLHYLQCLQLKFSTVVDACDNVIMVMILPAKFVKPLHIHAGSSWDFLSKQWFLSRAEKCNHIVIAVCRYKWDHAELPVRRSCHYNELLLTVMNS